MKKIKILAIALLLGTGTLAMWAFTPTSPVVNQQVEQWYQYDGVGDRTLPENYTLFGSSAPGCSGTEEVCAIKAMDNGNQQPEITAQLESEINAAIVNDTPSANVSLLD